MKTKIKKITRSETLEMHIHAILAGVLMNGFIQGGTKKKLDNSVLYAANEEILNTFLTPKEEGGELLKCKNCEHDIFWTEYTHDYAHKKYHPDICKRPEPEKPTAQEIRIKEFHTPTATEGWEERFDEKFAEDYYGIHGQGYVKLRDLTKYFIRSLLASAREEEHSRIFEALIKHFEETGGEDWKNWEIFSGIGMLRDALAPKEHEEGEINK